MAMPTDNGKDYFVNDFYKRTLRILTDYLGEYDVAMTINAMVGLLIVPKEQYFRSKSIPDSYVDVDILKQVRDTFTHDPKIPLTQILRHLRNSVSHGNMEIKAEKPNIIGRPMLIGSVVFADKSGDSVEIQIELLKRFLVSFATNLCSSIDAKGGQK